MTDKQITKRQLIAEIAKLRERIAILKSIELEIKKSQSETEEKYRNLVERANDGIAIIQDKLLKYVNPRMAEIGGYSIEELVDTPFTDYISPDELPKVFERYKLRMSGKDVPPIYELAVLNKNGEKISVELNAGLTKYQGSPADLVIVRDITERKRAEEKLRQSEQRFRAIFDNVIDGILLTDTKEKKFYTGNNMICKMLGYSLEEIKNLGVMDIHPQDELPYVISQFEKQWKGEITLARNIPVKRKDGSVFYADINSSLIALDGKTYLMGIFRDTTRRKQAEKKLKQSHEKMRRALDGIVSALASVVEMKDPYTAGHQKRVTNLACAIAEEMGLPKEQIEGLRIAGLIHDVGKIYIPVEILSKPTQLSEAEISIIRTHPRFGYDILKGIDFPWPVAKIVLQHHERMLGDGYPAGISGEDTLLEARILGVADVVEAMYSHRPYRPGLGIEKALQELSKNRGLLYDPMVVDTCLMLFKEKGFKFEEEHSPPNLEN